MKKTLKELKKVISYSLIVIMIICGIVISIISLIICWPLYLTIFLIWMLLLTIEGKIKITIEDEEGYNYNKEIKI